GTRHARNGRRAGSSAADADVAFADRAQCGSEVAETRVLARPQLHVGRSAAVARSTRSFARDGSPTKRFRWSFERSDEVGGDPATVEVARLRLHPLVAHPCDIHAA